MNTIEDYHISLQSDDKVICDVLRALIDSELPEAESKIWHRHPVWFLNGNPIVGYSKLKKNVRLLFWSGQSFEESNLKAEGSFKAAEICYDSISQIDSDEVKRWLAKARAIQWDYKNIVKRKGVLVILEQ